MTGPGECCDDMGMAVKGRFIVAVGGVLLLQRNLAEAFPEARAGNLLTGEAYDPSSFTMGFALNFCPFCGIRIDTPLPPDGEDGDGE